MQLIIGPRQTGKTTKLIEQSASSGYYIVCHNHNEAYRITEQAKKLDLSIPFPLTYDEFVNRRYFGAGVRGVLIDNVTDLLRYISTVPVVTVVVDFEETDEVRSQPNRHS